MELNKDDISVGVRSPYALTELKSKESIDWNKLSDGKQREIILANLDVSSFEVLFSEPGVMDEIYRDVLTWDFPTPPDFVEEPYNSEGED